MKRSTALLLASGAMAAAVASRRVQDLRALKAHIPGDVPEDHEDNTFGLPDGGPVRKQLKRFFREQLQKLVGFVATIGTTIPDTFPSLTDYNDPMASAMTPLIGTYWDRAGKGLRGRLGLDPDDWRVTDPNVHEAIKKQCLKFCASTNATTTLSVDRAREAVRAKLAAGLIGDGQTIPELTKAIRQVFTTASESRAETIARTETSRAVHTASLMSAVQSGTVSLKKWRVSANSCPVCVALAEKMPTAPLDQAFATIGKDADYNQILCPPAHPNCRCSMSYVPNDHQAAPAPAFVPKVAPAKAPKLEEFPADPEKLQVVKKLGGSTGAELVRDENDRLFVRKRGANPDHLREEVAADEAYRALGINVPDSKLFETKGGPVKLAKWIEGRTLAEVRKQDPGLAAKAEASVRKGFAADALLGNWDVIGLGADNVLVDSSGRPWRIDNVGSFRYRAQGGVKSVEQWNANPLDLWTMRDPKLNPSAAAVFGPLGFDDVAAQVDELVKKSGRLKLAPELAFTVDARLSQMKDLVKIGRTLRGDKFVDGYADDFCKHTSGIRAAGISARMPASLDQKSKGSVTVIDEQGKPFDHLRGKGSLIEDLAGYVTRSGGNYDAVKYYMLEQASDSWNEGPQALKSFLATQRGGETREYWWNQTPAECKVKLGEFTKKAGGQEMYRTAMIAQHAFTRELLTRVEFDGKDSRKGLIRLTRTEDKDVMKAAGLQRGDQDVKMKRGVLESTSIYKTVKVFGTEVTIQDVPIHRIFGTYWQERSPGRGGSAFLGDNENEFVAMLDDIPFKYKK